MKTPTAYYVAAAAVSAAWHPLLQLAPSMRRVLGGSSVLEVGVVTQLLLFVASGVLTACLFRSAIIREGGVALVGASLAAPFVAAELFALILVCWKSIEGTSGGGDLPAAVIGAPLLTLSAVYVVLPLGGVTTYLLRKAAVLDGHLRR